MQLYIKTGDISVKFAENKEHPVLGEYDSEVTYAAVPMPDKPEYISERRAQSISWRQRDIASLNIFMLRGRYLVELKCGRGYSQSVLRVMDDLRDNLVIHREDLNAIYYRLDREALIHFLHVFHGIYVFDVEALQDLMQSLQIIIPLTTQDGYRLLHEGKFEEVFRRVDEISDRAAYDMGKRCDKRYKNSDWAVRFLLHANKANEFYFKWAYTRALRIISKALLRGDEIYANIFEQMTFDEALKLLLQDTTYYDVAVWRLGICCEVLFPDTDWALTCFRLIPKSSEYYRAASGKILDFELSTLDKDLLENRETLFRRALAAAEPETQWMVDQTFAALCEVRQMNAVIDNIKGDADTLVALAAQIRAMRQQLEEKLAPASPRLFRPK